MTGTLEADGYHKDQCECICTSKADSQMLTFPEAQRHTSVMRAPLCNVDNTVFAAVPTNLTAVVKMPRRRIRHVQPVVFRFIRDAAFLTAMPAFTGHAPGTNDCNIDWRWNPTPRCLGEQPEVTHTLGKARCRQRLPRPWVKM